MTTHPERVPASMSDGQETVWLVAAAIAREGFPKGRESASDYRCRLARAAIAAMATLRTEAEAKARAEAFEEAAKIAEEMPSLIIYRYARGPGDPPGHRSARLTGEDVAAAIRQAAQPKVTPLMHDELIKRLESGSGPDRELDRFLCPNAKIHPVTGEWRHWNERKAGRKYGPQDNPIPAYTTSLSAARSLGGMLVFASDIGADGMPMVKLVFDTSTSPVVEYTGIAPTLERAWCVAFLRSRQRGAQP